MRPAAAAWEDDYAQKLEGLGFRRGVASPTVFHWAERDVQCVVHGDDLTFLGRDSDLKSVAKHMQGWYQLKIRAIPGADKGDDKSITILGRVVTWTNEGVEYKADPKHAAMIVEQAGLSDGSKALIAPAPKEQDESDEVPLEYGEARRYREIAARANYLVADRADIAHAVKELCKGMANPTNHHLKKLKHLARYLIGVPEVVIKYCWRYTPDVLNIYVDSDWAGCAETRKSTSGGIVCMGNACVMSMSTSQKVVALSSGEAELYALVQGASRALGLQSVLADLGCKMRIRVYIDSSAAKSIASRRGLGKVRHVDIRELWIQDHVKSGKIELVKIDGKLNPADVATKTKDRNETSRLLKPIGIELKEVF